MLFAVRFHDRQDQPALRKENLAAHIEWLDKHRDTILVAGSLRENPHENPVGGLWVVEASSKQAIEDLIASDPFTLVGLRQKFEILHWSKAFADRNVLV